MNNSLQKKIVIGLWPLSGDFGIRDLESDPHSFIRDCVLSGFTSFDTAPNYGKGAAERMLGRYLRDFQSQLAIATKLGNHHDGNKLFELDSIKRTFEKTISNLSGQIPSVALLHNPRIPEKELLALSMQLHDWLPACTNLGISIAKDSSYSPSVLNMFSAPPQVDYNLLFKHPDEDKLLSFQARSVFASGFLLQDLYSPIRYEDPSDHRSQWATGERFSTIMSQVSAVRSLIDNEIVSPYAMCLAFCGQTSRCRSIVVGVKNRNQLRELRSFVDRPTVLSQAEFDCLNTFRVALSNPSW